MLKRSEESGRKKRNLRKKKLGVGKKNFFFWPLGLWDLSFQTRDRTQALNSESTES